MIDSVARKKEGSKTRKKREISQRGKVVIREVNSILVLGAVSTCAHAKGGYLQMGAPQRRAISTKNTCKTHLGNAQILNGRNLVPYTRHAKVDINEARFSRCSTCSSQADVQ